MTLTVDRWLDIPSSRFAGDQPLGAGLVAMTANNATLAARENGLRTLWESRGSPNVWANLIRPGDPRSFPWDGEDVDGVFARHCGVHRVRAFGETIRVPRLRLNLRAEAPSTYEVGVVLAAMPRDGLPDGRLFASATTSSTSPANMELEIPLTLDAFASSRVFLRGDGGVDEGGTITTLSVFVGAWCTSDGSSSKGSLFGLTLSLVEP